MSFSYFMGRDGYNKRTLKTAKKSIRAGENNVDYLIERPEKDPVLSKLHELYHSLLNHQGFGEIRVEMKILKRGQKEVILHFGKQYRFVVDVPPPEKT